MSRQIDGRADGLANQRNLLNGERNVESYLKTAVFLDLKYRVTDGRTDRQTDSRTDGQDGRVGDAREQ